MSRNGSGTYIPPTSSFNPAVDGTPILSADWNTLLADLTLALTQSLASNGQTTAVARIPFAQGLSLNNGSVSVPSLSFTSDADTGLFRDSANTLAITAAGSQIATFAETEVTINGDLTVTGTTTLNGPTTIGSEGADAVTVLGIATFAEPVIFDSAQTVPRGIGRLFGTIINTTSVNGSQPTLVASRNVSAVSTVTVAGAVASATLTLSPAIPDTAYQVFVQAGGAIGTNETTFSGRTTTSVVISWEAAAGTLELDVAGF